MTKGEQKLVNLFRRGGIQFQQEVSFEDLHGKGKALLRFDFALYKNNKLCCLVEFDGIQHFQYTPYFHKTQAAFAKQKEWDRRKNKYCLLHNIPLIRVPYWDLEELTLKKVLTEPSYLVKDKYHIDNLIKNGVNKK
jgi:hypothetical protein